MNKITSIPVSHVPGFRFGRSILNKGLALCAGVLTISLGTASAQFTWDGCSTLPSSQTYDGLGVDHALNPNTIGSATCDDYITSSNTLTVLSGTLTINDDDFKVGNQGTFGSLILGTNATLNINNIGQWGGGVGWWTGNGGQVIISNNATLNWQIDGSSEQRFLVGGADYPSSGSITLNGGSMTVFLGPDRIGNISDSSAQFAVGCYTGPSGLGFLNLNAGTLTDAMPLPFCLGGFYNNVLGGATFSSGEYTNTINILNGTLVVSAIFDGDPVYTNGQASFNIGTNSYVNFIPGGTGTLSLTNWAPADYHGLVANGLIRVAGCPTTMGTLIYTNVNGMGVLQVGSLVVAASPAPNFLYTGEPIQLNGALYGFTSPTVQWQMGPDGVTWSNIPAATSTNYVFDTSGYLASATNYYQLVAMNTGGLTVTAAQFFFCKIFEHLN